jgi:hypothetical protein
VVLLLLTVDAFPFWSLLEAVVFVVRLEVVFLAEDTGVPLAWGLLEECGCFGCTCRDSPLLLLLLVVLGIRTTGASEKSMMNPPLGTYRFSELDASWRLLRPLPLRRNTCFALHAGVASLLDKASLWL